MGLSSTQMSVWAADILAAVGAPHTKNNVNNLAAWQACEGGGAANNPFNTTLSASGATAYNSAGVKNYPGYQEGLRATVSTMKQGNMSAIVGALKSDAPRAQFAAAVGGSPWGTSGSCIGSSRAAAGLTAGTGAGAGLASTTSSSSSQAVTLAASATDSAQCAWTFGGLPTSFGNIGQFCVISKSQLRAVIGGLFLVMGGIAMLTGTSLVAAAAALPALEAGASALVPIGRARALPGRYSSAVGGTGGAAGGGGREPYVSDGQQYGTVRRSTPASTGRRVTTEYRAARRRRPPADATAET